MVIGGLAVALVLWLWLRDDPAAPAPGHPADEAAAQRLATGETRRAAQAPTLSTQQRREREETEAPQRAASPRQPYRIEFTIEGAPAWTSARFVREDGRDVVRHEGRRRSGTRPGGELHVIGSGYLRIDAKDRVPWRSRLLHPPASGVHHVRARLERGLTTSGFVVAADGKTPITDGRVFARLVAESERHIQHQQVVDLGPDGRFSIGGFAAGRVQLEASASDGSLGNPARKDVAAGTADVRIQLDPTATLILAIYDAQGDPIPRARAHVAYRRADGRRHDAHVFVGKREKPTAARLTDLQRGEAGTVRITASGYKPFEVPYSFTERGGTEREDVGLLRAENRPAYLTLRVRFEGAEAQSHIQVQPWRGNAAGTATWRALDDDGALVLRVFPNTTSIQLSHRRFSTWVPTAVTFTEGEIEADARLEREVTLQLGGTIVLTRRPPFTAGTLTNEIESRPCGIYRTEKGGEIRAVPPGRWRYQIDGVHETWTGEVYVRAGETVESDPTIEAK